MITEAAGLCVLRSHGEPGRTLPVAQVLLYLPVVSRF